jgi:hypothetical protein
VPLVNLQFSTKKERGLSRTADESAILEAGGVRRAGILIESLVGVWVELTTFGLPHSGLF